MDGVGDEHRSDAISLALQTVERPYNARAISGLGVLSKVHILHSLMWAGPGGPPIAPQECSADCQFRAGHAKGSKPVTKQLAWLTITALATVAAPSYAGIIYDNGAVDLTVDGRLSDEGSPANLAADDFVLGAGANVVRDVHWWGVYSDNTPLDDFIVRFYADAGGVPTAPGTHVYEASVGAANRTSTGLQITGFYDVYAYSVSIPSFVATAGTTYWLSVVNNGGPNAWYWSFDNGGNGVSTEFGSSWSNVGDRHAFQLSDDVPVPEPGTLLLVGSGIVGMALRRRRAKS